MVDWDRSVMLAKRSSLTAMSLTVCQRVGVWSLCTTVGVCVSHTPWVRKDGARTNGRRVRWCSMVFDAQYRSVTFQVIKFTSRFDRRGMMTPAKAGIRCATRPQAMTHESWSHARARTHNHAEVVPVEPHARTNTHTPALIRAHTIRPGCFQVCFGYCGTDKAKQNSGFSDSDGFPVFEL